MKPAQLPPSYKSIYLAYLAAGVLSIIASLLLLLQGASHYVATAIALLSTGGFAWTVQSRLRSFHSHRHLPGPRPRFLLGNLPEFLRYGHQHRDRALSELHEEYGPVVCVHLGWGSPPVVSLNSGSKLLHSKELDSLREADRTVLGNNLMGIRMNETHRHRREILKPFLQSDRVRERVSATAPLLQSYLDRWQKTDAQGDSIQSDVLAWSIHSLRRRRYHA